MQFRRHKYITANERNHMLGSTLLRKRSLDPLEVFAHQFILSRNSEHTVDGFKRWRLSDWQLSAGKGLPVSIHHHDRLKLDIAVLGVAVDTNDMILDSEVLGAATKQMKNYDEIATYLSECAGRYAFVMIDPNRARIYGDPGNTLGFVYDMDTGTVGSTLHLTINRRIRANENTLLPIRLLSMRDHVLPSVTRRTLE